ncbi:HIT-like protein [Glonium stellatum]|uniref:HIT-like protein n=1 Tax=Glonium stellatum TaxID=574774 RepID=A0A8E2FDM5_9PEZI|nr:HIT-like protein [Glonium stellatum]
MNELDQDHYPQSCPFCAIASAYPPTTSRSLLDYVPKEEDADPDRIQPNAFVILSAPDVMAFLDILPMTNGHLLVATRTHRKLIGDIEEAEGREIGFWLPLLARTVAKVTGVADYNIVQNNGVRAAQVVPHVHFHIIPRPETMPEVKNKSWTMFGRGQRNDLDEEEAVKLAGDMRSVLREELGRPADGDSKGRL